MRITRRAIIAAAALAPGAAWAQAPESLMTIVTRTRAARIAGEVAAWRAGAESALVLAPEHPDFLVSAARANAAAGDYSRALNFAAQATARGAGFDLAALPEFAALEFNDEAAAIAERARGNLTPVPGGARFADLPGPECEGVACDPRTRRVFTGSGDGRVFAVSEDGAVTTFAEGLRQVLGMKVDARRRRLWLVDGRFPNLFAAEPEADAGYSSVRVFDLANGAEVGRWDLDERPTLHGFNDLVIARNGDVFITDTVQGSVYRIARGRGPLELFYAGQGLTFLNGLALTPDGRRLYLAHVEGISVLHVRTGAIQRLAVPANAAVNSIDGLDWLGGDLVGVQPSPYLARLARIRLDSSGEVVASVSAIIARTPAEYSYTTCAVAPDAVYLVGGAPVVTPAGAPLASEPSPHLWRVPL